MRKVITAMQMSLDGFIEGSNGELDWIENWEDSYDLMSQVDTCLLGGGMYPGYEQYWTSILADPKAVLPFSGNVATQGEIDYANFADRTPHVVLSTKLEQVAWKTARLERSIDSILRLKQQPGKDIYVVGGAALVGSLMNRGWIDELRLMVHPVALGQGKALFKDLVQRQRLQRVDLKPLKAGLVSITYAIVKDAR
jgi:dihydrofolate reductase